MSARMPSQLRVLALIDHLALGGAEMLLGRYAAVAQRAGIRLEVACLKQGDGYAAAAPLQAMGVQPVNLDIPPRLGPTSLSMVRRHIAAVEPNIVHTHLGSSDCLGALAARSLGLPAVSTIHAMAWGHGARDRAHLALSAFCRRHGADRVIAVSESSRRAYLARGWDTPARVVTIHNGIDVTPALGTGAAVRQELGLTPDDLVLGMVSALRPEKGHDVAIAAVAQLLARFPRLRLLIVGQGPERDRIARLGAPLGDRVIMAGMRTDVMSMFDAVDVCLHPSRADAFPTTLIEAMAASVPVVTTKVGGIPEMIEAGQSGILVSPPPTADHLARALTPVLTDPQLRQRLGEAGRERYARQFRGDLWLARTRALYDQVMGETRRSWPRSQRSSRFPVRRDLNGRQETDSIASCAQPARPAS